MTAVRPGVPSTGGRLFSGRYPTLSGELGRRRRIVRIEQFASFLCGGGTAGGADESQVEEGRAGSRRSGGPQRGRYGRGSSGERWGIQPRPAGLPMDRRE